MSRFAVFITIATLLLSSLHFYVWKRLVHDTALPPPWRLVATLVLVVLALSLPVTIMLRRTHKIGDVLVWPAMIWLGILFLLVVSVTAVDVVRLIVWVAAKVGGGHPPDPERRLFLARTIGGGVAALTAAATGVALRTALGRVRVKTVEVELPRLPPELDGTTIAQLTDIHVGPTIGREFIEQIVATTNALAPDVIAITGDLVDGSVAELGPAVAPLAELRARHGVFFVTGNHEYYAGAESWCAHLPKLGIRVLRNERVAIPGYDLAGIDDYSSRGMAPGHGPDLPRALAGRDPARPLVLLAHQPRAVYEAARHGVGLQLSGHTHGGQIWPWRYFVYLQQPFVAGLDRHRDTQVYVSCGTGYWGPPMRLGATPEITKIVLRSPRRTA